MKIKVLRILLLSAWGMLQTGCSSVKDFHIHGSLICPNQVDNGQGSPGLSTTPRLQPAVANRMDSDRALNSTNFSAAFVNGEPQDPILGFELGVLSKVPINSKLSAVPGLNFSTKGSQTSSVSTTNLAYLDLPLEIQYMLKPKISVSGGFQPSFLLSAKRKIERDGESRTDDVGDLYRGFDLAAILGAGYHFDNGLGIQLRYDHGLVNILEGDGSEVVGNRVWGIGVTYKLK